MKKKLLIGGLVLKAAATAVLFSGVLVASAETIIASPSYTTPAYPVYQSYCPTLSYNLYRGLYDYQTGGQVTQLQQFLATRYSQRVTGYFGPMTAANVAQFQREQAVYPITGGVGPLTRAAIVRVCGGVVSNTGFTATPTSGQTPLAVNFSVGSSFGSENLANLYIDFGDGQTGKPQTIYCFAAPCNPAMTASHTYQTAGTYVAKLYRDNNYCAPGMYCAAVYREPTLLGSVTVVANGTMYQAPSISGVSGPTQLTLGQGGTWQVRVNDNSNYLTYSVVWGDESTYNNYASSLSPSTYYSGTFTHTYQSVGTYTPRFTVTNGNGQSASASATVVVTGGATICTQEAMQCPNGTWVGRSGPNCQFVCPTY